MPDSEFRNQLLKAARAYADRQCWPWLEPTEVSLATSASGQQVWLVRTNIFAVGMNVRILIREPDLTVVEATFLPR